MIMKQSDFFWGLHKDVAKEFMENAQKYAHDKDEVLFREGDPAERFYILLKGRVRLTIGQNGRSVYMVSHPGEAFGWSSLIERTTYAASAICLEPTKLLVIEKQAFERILQDEPEKKMLLYKRLAEMLGHRLIMSYRAQAAAQVDTAPISFGSGQLQDYPLGL